MKVYILIELCYEASHVVSVHKRQASADRAMRDFMANSARWQVGHYHMRVEEHEVKE